jgi:hypothetical protein
MTEQPIPAGAIPPGAVPAVQVQPVPLSFTVQVMTTPTGNLVVLVVNSPMGQNVLFLDPDAAITVGGLLRSSGKQAKSGLAVPHTSGLIVPGSPNGGGS